MNTYRIHSAQTNKSSFSVHPKNISYNFLCGPWPKKLGDRFGAYFKTSLDFGFRYTYVTFSCEKLHQRLEVRDQFYLKYNFYLQHKSYPQN